MTSPTRTSEVIVVGGGLAGIAAALALQESGHRVTLYEARARLGGATHSFQRGGLWVDNGQHVFLRCCTAYQGLLRRLGTDPETLIQERFDITVLAPGGTSGRLRRARLPGPFHLLPALAGYRLLSPADRLRTVRATLALQRLNRADAALDQISVADWLSARGQNAQTQHALWELFVIASLNAAVEDASMAPAAMVFQTALLGRADAADIGVPTVPLGELHGTAAEKVITSAGGVVHRKAKVTAVREGPSVVVDGETRHADAVVVAVPHPNAATLLDDRSWEGLGSSPIVNVHVIYDRKVTDLPFAAAVGSPVQWVFDRTAISGLDDGGQYLAVSLSAADAWLDLPAAELRAVFQPELESLFPAARSAQVLDFFVTRERNATFRQAPGSTALRPGARTRLPGVFLAGAWTDTGWPDTMEGAVRSGLTAARHVRSHLRSFDRHAAAPREVNQR